MFFQSLTPAGGILCVGVGVCSTYPAIAGFPT